MDIQNLETQYLRAKIAYYEGNPIMTDAAFDVLEKELKDAGSKVIEQVGAKRKDFDFPHPTAMLSLSKLQTENVDGVTDYKDEEFKMWFAKREVHANQLNASIDHMHYSPKFDGSAINIVYRNGVLDVVLTRGDGKAGKNAIDRFRQYLPEFVEYSAQIVEIRCEAVMRRSTFEAKYADKFANPRNIVSGIIGSDDIEVEKVADINLIPVHILFNGVHQDINKSFKATNGYSIFAPTHNGVCRPTVKDYLYIMKYMEDFRKTCEFQLDGVVFALPSEYREIFGENEHDPEWSIAIKFVPEEVVTPVIGIEWNLGKTGEFTPVVKLKPVQLAGTTVKRASGYNAGYIVNNKIGEGAFVSIAKAGDIIPEIQTIHNPGRLDPLPSTCPSCQSTLTFDGIHLMCQNNDCVGKIARKLGAAVGILDLKGIGGKTIEPFSQDFTNMSDLLVNMMRLIKSNCSFSLSKYGLADDSRSFELFVQAFKNIKSLTYAQVILIQGYDGIGRKVSEQAAREYCGLTPNYASIEKALVRKLQEPEVISHIKSVVSELESLGITIDKPEDKKEETGTVYVCMTGSPKPFGFKTKEEFISKFPNLVEVSVTDKNCNFLITDDLNSTSSKMKAAEKKGVKIVTYGSYKN